MTPRNNTRRNQRNRAFHALPFTRAFFAFLHRNQGKEHSLILGIGTSGSRNVREAAIFANEQSAINRNKAFFLLMIDTEYRDQEEINISLDPLEGRGYMRTAMNQVFHEETGNTVYLWGATLPTAYDSMEKYSELRDNHYGPYDYGRQCEVTAETRDFYAPLTSFFRGPILKNIYVYNQGVYNTRTPEYIMLPDRYYNGPEFREQRRIVKRSLEEMQRGPRAYSPMLSVGDYFENYCELLFCLARANKPVYLLKENTNTRELVPSVLYRMGGGQRTKKTRKTYTRRKTTR